MNSSIPKEAISVTTGHLDDPESMRVVCEALSAIHGPEYGFSVARWQGETHLTAPRGRQQFFFVLEAENARILLSPGQRVRGIPPSGPYLRIEEHWAAATAAIEEEVWPGDVICIDSSQCRRVTVT